MRDRERLVEALVSVAMLKDRRPARIPPQMKRKILDATG